MAEYNHLDRIAALRASLEHSLAERDRLRALHTALAADLRQAVAQVVAERDRLRARIAAALALTDTGSPEFLAAFPAPGVQGWWVVEKVREALLGAKG